MKRNLISWFKFLVLAAFTVFLTTLIFRFLRGPRIIVHDSPAARARFLRENGKLAADAIQSPLEHEVIIEGKIDWHDYERIQNEEKRTGTGEQGKAATLSPSMEDLKDRLYKVNGFNAALSDLISLNRSIPDIRHPDCKNKRYLKDLDPVSVVVSFHNEHFSTLMRTCWSVINRSPPSLLHEIILVDDASTKVELKDKLDEYVKKNLPKVKIVRLPRRSGLIRGRLAGARKATAKILVFLDSHSEANVNWLPPLLEPIAKDYKTCVCPFIDVIAYETFEYRAQDEGARGAFDWELYYKRLPLLPEDLKNPSEPFKSPVMAGGLFAISAKFFWELGGYDPGLDIWGGEQYELSFKIWQCGGQMYDAPCSRVGHIYRKFPPFPNPGRGDFLGKNYKRVAEVWMDEYADFIYRRRPHLRAMDPGDLTEQKALRDKLKCKSFKWFMENIAFDLVEVYPPIEPDDFAYGEMRNIGVPNLCLDAKGKGKDEEIAVDYCQKDTPKIKGEQEFQLTWHKDIRPNRRTECLDVSRGDDKSPVTLYPCHGKQGNQLWRYNVEKQWLQHGYGSRCLDMDPASKKVYVSNCDPTSSTQKWRIEHVNMKAMNNWENVVPKANQRNDFDF
ncbi:polypeptide GalNAc transferase 6-like [Nasonia vitripennis]|uniref:Polypeptide N-acetylgalactosaminyltransferase n=1 Tax=Nasonia vitripennis TaxID=7425 RepID=A0A7M6UV83_NASVI|nr:polypeptide GalNAc transferase 6-like [Nasonia vitripennis]